MTIECPKCQHENPDDMTFCGKCGTKFDADMGPTKTIETPTEELKRGSVFAGRYEIIEELGKGGMGKVYRVEDRKAKEEIALKLIKPEIAADKKTIERFRKELTTARKVAHRNVCRMFDLGEEKGLHYITMEYVSGGDLKRFIRRVGQLPVGKAISVAKQICEGLEEAHSLGIVHRDLKPNNIMIDDNGNARIMDFGIARTVKEKGVTGSGVMIGTPEYMSPEQAEAKDVDSRSDIYSLGIILYEMVTGRLPFEGDTPLAVAMKHKGELPRSPKEYNPQIPDDLNKVILKCLAKEKENRYGDAGELRRELTDLQEGVPTAERIKPPKMPLTSREITVTFGLKKLLLPALVILVLAAIAVTVWRIHPKEKVYQAPVIENSVAVISFQNLTGDEKYDNYRRSVPNLLITNLENAGFFYVLSWERMRDLLEQIGIDDSAIIESDAGFKICRREGIQALVTGSINKAGDMFAIELRILDVETKRHLQTTSTRGVGEQSIIETQIDELSRKIAQGIGISHDKIEESKIHIADVTTDSIEAYNLFLKGQEQLYNIFLDEAQESLEKAVEIDPAFASAYRILSLVYNQANNPKASEGAIKKAKEFSEKATEKEKLFIEATYARIVNADIDRSRDIFDAIIEKYPREKRGYFWSGVNYYLSGYADKAIELFEKALELDPAYGEVMNMIAYAHAAKEEYDKGIGYLEKYASLYPDTPNPRDSLGELYFAMGRLDDAIATYKETLEIKTDFGSDQMLSYIYALKEDYDEALKWIERFILTVPSPGRKAGGHFWKGCYYYWLGNLKLCLNEFQTAEDQAEKIENEPLKANIGEIKGWIYLDRGDFERSRQCFKTGFDLRAKQFPSLKQLYEAVYLINIGFVDLKQSQIESAKSKAAAVISILDEINPEFKEWIKYLYDILHTEILLAENSVQQAITIAEQIEDIKISTLIKTLDETILYNFPFYRDTLARAYAANGETDKAIAAYEKLITFNPQKKGRYLVHPLSHYRLAKLYQEKGLVEKAVEQLEKFLDLWKSADHSLTAAEDAKKRLVDIHY